MVPAYLQRGLASVFIFHFPAVTASCWHFGRSNLLAEFRAFLLSQSFSGKGSGREGESGDLRTGMQYSESWQAIMKPLDRVKRGVVLWLNLPFRRAASASATSPVSSRDSCPLP